MRAWIAAVAATIFMGGLAFADGPSEVAPLRPPPGSIRPQVEPAGGAEKPQRGAVVLPSGMDYAIPAGFSYYSPKAAREYLDRAGRPAPEGEIQGLIAPANADFYAADFWGGVIAFNKIGHVRPEGADKLGHSAFITEVRDARRGLGQTPPDSFLIAPAHDSAAQNLVWAESYTSAGPSDRSVRHEMRALGREGVMSLTTLVTPVRFDAVKANQAKMLQSLTFPAGKTYADFVEATDAKADFDIAGLISGKRFAPPAPPVAEEPKTAEGGGWMSKAFPWIGAGLVIIPAILWIVYGRRRRLDDDEEDPNLTPHG